MLPNRLKYGDTIGIISPAGPAKREDIEKAIPFFEKMGLSVRLGKHVNRDDGYLAGTDGERLQDFHEMICDPHIKGIFCTRGGYGTARIVPFIDYELVKQHPKIIWGYSDITYLHTAIRQQTGLVTFHGPMLASDIAKDDFDPFSAHMFHQLFQPTKLIYSENITPLEVRSHGSTEGMLVGGNLTVLLSTMGTPYEIDVKGKLLLIEDIGEEPYQIDRMLQQLQASGKLQEAKGVLVGDFSDIETDKPSFTLDEILRAYFSGLNIPVISGFKIGHCFPHFAVPFGVQAKLCTEQKVCIINPGVR